MNSMKLKNIHRSLKKKKKKKTAKNKKTVFKQIIIFKDKMDVFQKGDIKTEKK